MLGPGLETAPQHGLETAPQHGLGSAPQQEIQSGRSGSRSTEKAATPGRGKGFPDGEANSQQAGSMRSATPVCRGPSRDHRQNAGARERPRQSSPGEENYSGPATCRTP